MASSNVIRQPAEERQQLVIVREGQTSPIKLQDSPQKQDYDSGHEREEEKEPGQYQGSPNRVRGSSSDSYAHSKHSKANDYKYKDKYPPRPSTTYQKNTFKPKYH